MSKVLSKGEVLALVRSKSMSPTDAMEALRSEPEEIDKLDEIKKILKDISIQNLKLIEIAKADLIKPEDGTGVINALQLQTKDIIKALKQVEEMPTKKWKLQTGEIERGRDGKVTSMEVIAVQI